MKQPILLLVLALCGSPVLAQVTDSTPVIQAGDLSLTRADFEELVKGDERYEGMATTPAGKRALAVDFGKAFALEAEARKRRIDQQPSVQLQIRHATQQLLAYELMLTLRRDYVNNEAALAAHYERNKDLYAQPRVRQILVRAKGSNLALRPGQRDLPVDEARAKAAALRAQLGAGADFEALAKTESDDLGSRPHGGDMGFVMRGTTGANFEAAAFSLAIGELSEVIHTEQGFHILRVEERQPQPLSAVKDVLANDLAQRDLDVIVLNGFKLNEAYFSQ